MKKLIPIIGFAMLIVGILGWHETSYPQLDVPHSEANTCWQAYEDSIEAIENSWEENLQTLMDQEKASSEMVDEAFEGFRSYKCMLEYVCRSVQYSGYGSPLSAIGTGLTKAHIGSIAGCQDPEDIGLPGGFEEVMTSIITLGYDQADIQYNKYPFYEQCMTDVNNPESISLTSSQENYNTCMQYIDKKLGCRNTEEGVKNCLLDNSSAFVKMETALRKNQADQKVAAFENKMNSIMTKMFTLEAHVGYLQNNLRELYNRYDCFPSSCN
ncbi:hypothetical protein KKA95_03090 [Patescibacteria group bacterium]|nr:hypothetical protein [Patescibacteria group bacterium]